MNHHDFWQGKYPESIARTIDTNIYPTILDLFKEACRKYANKPAFSNMGRTLTFAEVDKYSATFAAWIQQNTDLQVGDRIAVQMPNLLQYPIVVFGAMRAGLVIVNTNPLYTAREMEHQFKDAGCKALVTLANWCKKSYQKQVFAMSLLANWRICCHFLSVLWSIILLNTLKN